MIAFESFTLANGLQVIVHQDAAFPTAVVNIAYNVGSKDEPAHKTGFAHLFEHLMFGGSTNVPSFDSELQQVGGVSNAFTSPDLTNYYDVVPAQNLETAFWLESDRMLSLSFDPQELEVQRKVVIEEFKQRYLEQPYGDTWMLLREMAYKEHPYRWMTIGKEIAHIEQATLEDVRDFFFRFYRPNNAVLVVAGNVTLQQVQGLAEKWFGAIPAGEPYVRALPQEPAQTEARFQQVEADVPVSALNKVWHMGGRNHPLYYACDALSDILSRGKSSVLYQQLVRERKLFSNISAHLVGSTEPGLFCISGRLQEGVTLEEADAALCELLEQIRQQGVQEEELQKVKNQLAYNMAAGKAELLPRAMALAYGALLGDPGMVNTEMEKVTAVTTAHVMEVLQTVLRPENCSTLYYKAQPQEEEA